MRTQATTWFAATFVSLLGAVSPARAQAPAAAGAAAPAPAATAPAAAATAPTATPTTPAPSEPTEAPQAPAEPAATSAESAPDSKTKTSAPPPAPQASGAKRAAAARSTNAAGVPLDELAHDDGLMGSHQTHFYGVLGYRAAYVRDAGFDPFSSNDALDFFSMTVGRVLMADGNVSLGLGLGWDYGHSESTARDTGTALDLHRLVLSPEARYHFARRLYGFGRVGAGAAFIGASLKNVNGSGSGEANEVAFTMDPSLGVAWEALGEPRGDSKRPRLWILGDAGYLFTTKTELMMTSDSGSPERAETTSLGELGVSGFTFRLLAAVTY